MTVIYHTGLLMLDRQHDPRVEEEAKHWWGRYERGEVALTQRRLADGKYAYAATDISDVAAVARMDAAVKRLDRFEVFREGVEV